MAKCGHCESHITEDYARTFAPSKEEQVEVCPHCPDRKRVGSDWEEYKNK